MLPLRFHHVIGKDIFINLNIYIYLFIFYLYIYIFKSIFKSQGKNVQTKNTSKEKYWVCGREGRRGQEEKLLGSQKYKPLI